MTNRINARLDAALARKVEQLCKLTGKSASAVIKAALESYYERTASSAQHPKAALEQAGFIASGSGAVDLSTSYKAALAKSLSSKT
jgi:predicted transcriptional regulator